MTRSEHIRALLEEYAAPARPGTSASNCNARVEAAERRDPEIARLRARQRCRWRLGTMRTIHVAAHPGGPRRGRPAHARAGVRLNNAEIRRRLKALGLPEDDLELKLPLPRLPRHGLCGRRAGALLRLLRSAGCAPAATRTAPWRGTGEQNVRALRPEPPLCPRRTVSARGYGAGAGGCCEEYADRYPRDALAQLCCSPARAGWARAYLLNCVYARVSEPGPVRRCARRPTSMFDVHAPPAHGRRRRREALRR